MRTTRDHGRLATSSGRHTATPEQVFSSELRASKFTFLRVTGMVLAGALEAMPTGTPVIARRHGSAPEVIDEGFPVSWTRSMRPFQLWIGSVP